MPPPITTRSYNNARTGATDDETVLFATAVRTRGIVKLFSMTIPDDPRLTRSHWPWAVCVWRMDKCTT